MVEITQTEDEIKINIKLINITSRHPDIVLLQKYVKFNLHPVFFEAHLTNEIDEANSSCKLFKREARILLKKKVSGIWEEIFEKLPKPDALERRKEMVDKLQEKNKEIEKDLLKKYDDKKRAEVNKEIERDSVAIDKFQKANKEVISSHFGKKENQIEEIIEDNIKTIKPDNVIQLNDANPVKAKQPSKFIQEIRKKKINPLNHIRSAGKINVNFTTHNFSTPKRESQNEWQAEYQAEQLRRNMKIV